MPSWLLCLLREIKKSDNSRGSNGNTFWLFLYISRIHWSSISVFAITNPQYTVLLKLNPWDKTLSLENRFDCLKEVCRYYDNVIPIIIDVSKCRNLDWTEDWDAETPLVRKYIKNMAYVYSSEESYWEYFARAYPEAQHHIVDAKRVKYPISGTLIRVMETLEEKQKWMVWNK